MSYAILPIRLKQSEYERLKALAAANKQKPSTYLRVILGKAKLPKNYKAETQTEEAKHVSA